MNKDFLNNVPSELDEGVNYILNSFFNFYNQNRNKGVELHDKYIEYSALLEAYLKSKSFPFSEINLESEKSENLKRVVSFYTWIRDEFQKRNTKDFVLKTREHYNSLFNNVFSYKFTDGDLKRIQVLINELREQLSQSEVFSADHKQRLLKRLERLQSELHKNVSDLDRFWGLIGDAGIAIGKFGTDSKPFVNRIKEITDIVWRTQSRAEELPSGTVLPFLKPADNE